MLWTLLCLIVLILIVWYWLANTRCREFALTHAKSTCKNYDWTLLDESVAMIAWRPTIRSSTRPCIRRTYQFEYTRSGTERGFARITLLGHELSSSGNTNSLPHTSTDQDDRIISLARYRTSHNDEHHPHD